MSYKIIVTSEFELTFDRNLIYLAKEWNDKIIEQFLDRVDNVIREIRENPFLFPSHEYEKNVRKVIINKRIILYYRIVDDSSIELLTFRNTYQNPKEQKL